MTMQENFQFFFLFLLYNWLRVFQLSGETAGLSFIKPYFWSVNKAKWQITFQSNRASNGKLKREMLLCYLVNDGTESKLLFFFFAPNRDLKIHLYFLKSNFINFTYLKIKDALKYKPSRSFTFDHKNQSGSVNCCAIKVFSINSPANRQLFNLPPSF